MYIIYMSIVLLFVNFKFNTFVSKFEASCNCGYLRALQNSAQLQQNTILLRSYGVLYIKLDLYAIFDTLSIIEDKIILPRMYGVLYISSELYTIFNTLSVIEDKIGGQVKSYVPLRRIKGGHRSISGICSCQRCYLF